MKDFSRYHSILLLFTIVLGRCNFLAALCNDKPVAKEHGQISRRAAIYTASQILAGGALVIPLPAFAAADCFQDCFKNCKQIAPKDPDYCTATCKDYCEQDDRTDGLSGSVSAANGEVGILGGTFGQGTVPKGEDKVRI